MDDHEQNQFQSPERDDHVPLQDKKKAHGSGEGKPTRTSDKLAINLKNPRTEHRLCKICKKAFSSGQALGGHMRVHRQANNLDHLPDKIQNSELKTHDPKLKTHLAGNLMSDGKPTCFICDKDFPSMKSLFGHMKSHPEREWRGVQPPPLLPKNSSCSTVSDVTQKKDDLQVIDSGATQTIDLSNSLPRWSVTDKRGRKRKAASTSLKEQKPDALAVRYKCSDCNKSFPTHQALGGHRSFHMREKRRESMDADDLTSSQVDESGEECRSHWTGPTIEEARLSEEASPGESSQIAGHKVFEFDLNEMPFASADEE